MSIAPFAMAAPLGWTGATVFYERCTLEPHTAEGPLTFTLYDGDRQNWTVTPHTLSADALDTGLKAKVNGAWLSEYLPTPQRIIQDHGVVVVQMEVQFEAKDCTAHDGLQYATMGLVAPHVHERIDQSLFAVSLLNECAWGTSVVFSMDHVDARLGRPVRKAARVPRFLSHELPDVADGLTHLVTAAVRNDSTVSFWLDAEPLAVRSMDDESDFRPPVRPTFVDDPDDRKPAGWVDEPFVDDPADVQPEWWDVAFPRFLNETTKVPNPAYKPWTPHRVTNPLYIGAWTPRKIRNPFPDLAPPWAFAPVGGVELVLSKAALVDNVLVTGALDEARAMWEVPFGARQSAQRAVLKAAVALTLGDLDDGAIIQEAVEEVTKERFKWWKPWAK